MISIKTVKDGKLKFLNIKNYYSDFVFYFLKNYCDELNTSMSILDAGCGHARNLNFLYSLGFKDLTGIDIIKRANNRNFTYIEKDITTEIPGKYDIVMCNFVLMFIETQKQLKVIDKLLAATKQYLLIETRKNDTSEYTYTCYIENFYNYILAKKEYKIIYYSKSKERLLVEKC